MDILEHLSKMDKNDAIALLKGSYAVFCAAVQSTLDRTVRSAIVADDDSEEQARICKKAGELRQLGYTRVESLIDNQQLLALASHFAKVLRYRADVLGVAGDNIVDPQLGGVFIGRHESKFNTRIAFNAEAPAPFLRPILDLVAVSDKIVNKAIGIPGAEVRKNELIVDNLQPTTTVDFQWWHFDRLFDQYKVMIFLDDVRSGNGPMRLLPGTHIFEGVRRIHDFCTYSEPYNGADPGYNAIRHRLAEIVSAEGEAGDGFIFDTKVFHANGRPTEAERNTATIYYRPPNTPLNYFYAKYRPEGQHLGY